MAKATFIGHGSLKFETNAGQHIYVDPYFKGDYSAPANFMLITHEHFDHFGIDKVKIAPGCTIIMPLDAMWDGKYQTFEKDGVKITAVQAYNKNHSKDECVGYVLEFDGVKVYCAGDTSTTEDIEKKIPKMKVDYAFLPIDGVYNMGPKEATYCAKRIKASKGNIAIHNDPQSNRDMCYYETGLDEFTPDNKIVLKHGETMEL